MDFKALGNKVTEFTTFETFDKPERIRDIIMRSDEVTALCPVTGQPDQYKVEINYAPAHRCIESKTLKLYLQSFRMKGLFCEAFASQIADDISLAIKPKFISVTVTQKPRGGVSIEAIAARDLGSLGGRINEL